MVNPIEPNPKDGSKFAVVTYWLVIASFLIGGIAAAIDIVDRIVAAL